VNENADVQAASEPPKLARIIDDWQPRSADEESKRAYFFLHLIGAHCLTHLQDFLADCQHSATISVPDVLRVVKLLVCASSYLAVLESTTNEPYSWLMDWLLQVLAQLDELLPDPPARRVAELLGAHDPTAIMAVVTDSSCSLLSLRRTADQKSLTTMLSEDRGYRNELLVMSLTHPLDDLRHHIMLFG
jgi:hypothetical protein